jgi:hypothetical protein
MISMGLTEANPSQATPEFPRGVVVAVLAVGESGRMNGDSSAAADMRLPNRALSSMN